MMKTLAHNKAQEQGSATIFYMLLMLVVISLLAAAMTYVSGSVRLEHRRYDLQAAQQYAEGGAVIACDELSTAFGKSGTLATNVGTAGYTLNSTLSTSSTNVYQRTISTPFTNNQTVTAQLWVPNTSAPKSAKVVAIATKNQVTQSATVNVSFSWGYPAAIIDTNAGDTSTSFAKSAGQAGDVAINGSSSGPLVIDGGQAKAVLSNANVNIDYTYATVPKTAVSASNYNTSNAIPDYTAQGTANALFDFNRFIAAADATPNTLNTTTGTNHFASLGDFMKANAAAAATPAGALEGIIVVDIASTKDPGVAVLASPESYVGTAYMPAVNPQKKGITVRGTLFFNFGPAFGPLDKIFNRTPMNINPADMTNFKATDPTTYPSGYPPTYYDSSKNPVNVNISGKGYTNFASDEDLPALMYSIGTLDMHGPSNISGVMYTPSYSEIENRPGEGFKIAGQTQYIKGSLIVGMGTYIENNNVSNTVISYDSKTLDSLATMGGAGKKVTVTNWQ